MSKSRDAFRTISEVSDWLDTPAHVLRFWESKFSQVKPVKRAGGRRYYRPMDMALLGGIKKLLHEDGMTIKGVQKLLREKGVKHVAALAELPEEPDSTPPTVEAEPQSTATVADPPAPAPAPPPAEDNVVAISDASGPALRVDLSRAQPSQAPAEPPQTTPAQDPEPVAPPPEPAPESAPRIFDAFAALEDPQSQLAGSKQALLPIYQRLQSLRARIDPR